MAKKKLPDPLRRRHLVEQPLDPSRALQIAEAYLEDDRAIEAVAFLLKAEARERLAALREQAVRDGDAFLLREISTALAMALRCLVVRGLVKEVEEDVNKFLASHDVNVLHMAQSEHGEYLSLTLIYEEPDALQ